MNSVAEILLVLDLDETLVFATKDSLTQGADFKYADYYVYRRPYLTEFFNALNDHFQIAIWSSADDTYVKDVVERIKPAEVNLQFIWGRSRCTTKRDFDSDEYVHQKRLKKVKKLGYELERILMIDDSPEKTRDNYGNAVYVAPFEGNQEDNELKALVDYLMSIRDSGNVREIEKRGWKNKTTAYNKT